MEYKPWQQIAVSFPEDLKVGQVCVLTLDYAASLSHTYDGFYNSSYNDKTGAKRYAKHSKDYLLKFVLKITT